jgi:Mannitol repressor
MRQAPTEAQVYRILQSLERPRRSTETDRAIALVGANLIDHCLQLAILTHFVELGKTDIESLFEVNGPLATFAGKIKIAYALGIIRSRERADLNTIRVIRNVFAHMPLHVSFRTPAVTNACRKLYMEPGGTAKKRFIASVAFLSGVLSGYAEARIALGAKPRKTAAIDEPSAERLDARLRPVLARIHRQRNIPQG